MSQTHTPPAGSGAMPDMIVMISVDKSKPLGPGGPQKWNAFLDGDPLVARRRVPMYDSCRALLDKGITGTVAFIHSDTGTVGMSMDIEKGAKLTVVEEASGPKVRRHTDADPDNSTVGERTAVSATDVAEAVE